MKVAKFSTNNPNESCDAWLVISHNSKLICKTKYKIIAINACARGS